MTRTTVNRYAPSSSQAPSGVSPDRPKETNRETIESLVVALILALMVRGFEAEAFVIPTGSMAPTLMGRHKEITCPQCGHVYTVNAAEEVEAPSLGRVERGTCDNCRYPARVGEEPSFKGDRILVMKFPYEMPWLPGARPPERGDVIVFHFPEDPETNYIKRLVGLPDEEVRIHMGDILARPLGSDEPFRLTRMSPARQQAMQILVYDDRHRPEALEDDPRWKRWISTGSQIWVEEESGVYTARARPGAAWSVLRYRHLVPDSRQWEAIRDGLSLPHEPRPTLVTDFYAYNTSQMSEGRLDSGTWMQPHWVGDLTIGFDLELEASEPDGRFRVELVKGGIAHACQIDLTTGEATLWQGDRRLGTAPTRVQGRGRHHIRFANINGRLTLWVDGRLPFGDGLVYDEGDRPRPVPTARDLEPVAIAASGAEVRVSRLVLTRDIYYTLSPGRIDYTDLFWDRYPQTEAELFDWLADPERFAALARLEPQDYPITPGHYMVLGDNSPRSKDARGWGLSDRRWDPSDRESWEVPESLLIGKAFFIYWPHGQPIWPDIAITRDLRVPFRPYFERMTWIR